jgi:hypothetical protein
VDEAQRVLRPLKAHGRPVLDLCTPKPDVDHQAMFDASFPHGWWYYMRSCDVPELTDDIIDLTVAHAVPIWQLGGARARVADDATAFTGRSAGFTFNITGATETAEGFDVECDWVRQFWDRPRATRHRRLLNFLMDEGPGRVRQAHGPQTSAGSAPSNGAATRTTTSTSIPTSTPTKTSGPTTRLMQSRLRSS